MGNKSDPWQEERTIHNLAADEVVSALQKEIRRGHAEKSSLIAYEMKLNKPDWKISCGAAWWSFGRGHWVGETQAALLDKALIELQLIFKGRPGPMLVSPPSCEYLCGVRKRTVTMKNYWPFNKANDKPEKPDNALDKDTVRGKKWVVFGALLIGASRTFPEKEERNKEFRWSFSIY